MIKLLESLFENIFLLNSSIKKGTRSTWPRNLSKGLSDLCKTSKASIQGSPTKVGKCSQYIILQIYE